MNMNIMLKATREIWKQFNAEFRDYDETSYRNEYIKSIQRAFDTNMIESEILMYLAEWDWYVRPMDNMDFTLIRDEKDNHIRARTWGKNLNYNIKYEFNANYDLKTILDCLEQIDRERK